MRRILFDPFAWVIAAAAAYCCYVGYVRYIQTGPLEQLKEADEAYRQGENAKNAFTRKAAFNKALAAYTNLEKNYDPKFGDGKLYYDIGNAYYQLSEYPLAILYYNRAEALRPRDGRVASNLKIAQEKIGLKVRSEASPWNGIFFFYHYLSIPERLQLFTLFTLLATATLSFYIWFPRRWLIPLVWIFGICCTVLLLSLAYSYYVSPVEGIILRSSTLYRHAGKEYALVSEVPVPSGTRVEVLDEEDGGKWLKVMTPAGEVGYISNEAMRVI